MGFPNAGPSLAKMLLTDMLGDASAPPHPTPNWVRLGFYATLTCLSTVTQAGGIFLLYWVLQTLTCLQAIFRWGAICVHKYNLPNANMAESSPIILPRWWEKLMTPECFTIMVHI